jgi:hypothetical protein
MQSKKGTPHMHPNDLELYAIEEDLVLEELPQGNALGTMSSSSTASCAACPISSASTLTTTACYF